MIAREYIDKNLQPLFRTSTVEDAIRHFIENKLNETFILEEDRELHLLKFADIIYQSKSQLAKPFATPFTLKLTGDIHWSQLLTFYKMLNVEVLPVYNLNYDFAGLITKNNLISNLADFNYLEEPGAILMLECNPNFYAASEVIRIAEMYNARVISLFTHHQITTQKLIITLKINLQETKGITNTYERFGYEVTNVFMNKDFDNDLYTDRYASLLKIFDLK